MSLVLIHIWVLVSPGFIEVKGFCLFLNGPSSDMVSLFIPAGNYSSCFWYCILDIVFLDPEVLLEECSQGLFVFYRSGASPPIKKSLTGCPVGALKCYYSVISFWLCFHLCLPALQIWGGKLDWTCCSIQSIFHLW